MIDPIGTPMLGMMSPLSYMQDKSYIQDALNLLWLLFGLFIAGLLEGVLWKTPMFEWCNVPIQAVRFGPNKRWRGLISLPLTTVLATLGFQVIESSLLAIPENWIHFSDFNALEYGLLTGLFCNLAELPNSFVKRRLNIPPGDESQVITFITDHLDSTLGILILWGGYFHFPGHFIRVGLVVSPLLFMMATWIRKGLKLKA